jgi:hypothetical protein
MPGLRKAELRGARDREVRVLVDQTRALQYDLTLAEISSIIGRNNQNFAGGSFTDPGSREITVRGLGQFASPELLARTVVVKNPDGSHVLLGDVAEVVSGFAKRRIIGRENGIPAVSLGISKEADTDLIDLVARVRAFLDEYAATIPEGVEASIIFNSADYVSARMDIMKSNLLLGVVFVILILWLTVGFRNAMLAIVGVPFSFLSAMILFPVFDITINSLSLIGFVMVSGMLVDDAIIILENIYRHVEAGEPLREAVVNAHGLGHQRRVHGDPPEDGDRVPAGLAARGAGDPARALRRLREPGEGSRVAGGVGPPPSLGALRVHASDGGGRGGGALPEALPEGPAADPRAPLRLPDGVPGRAVLRARPLSARAGRPVSQRLQPADGDDRDTDGLRDRADGFRRAGHRA